MATPRKHWFRVADSLGKESLGNDELATLVRLMCELNTRWARNGLTAEEACSVVLRPADLMALTDSGSLARARRIVNALATHVSLTVDEQGANTSLKWPKWAIFQELRSPEPPRERPDKPPETPSPHPHPQDAPASAPEERETPTREEPVAFAPSHKRGVVKDQDPWLGAEHRLTPKQLDKLRSIPIRGLVRPESDVVAWFMAKAPVMAAKGYRSLYRTALNWWPNARPDEIEAAVVAYGNRKFQRHCELNPLPPYDEEAELAKVRREMSELGWGRVVQ